VHPRTNRLALDDYPRPLLNKITPYQNTVQQAQRQTAKAKVAGSNPIVPPSELKGLRFTPQPPFYVLASVSSKDIIFKAKIAFTFRKALS
jgi:hypothetical protein